MKDGVYSLGCPRWRTLATVEDGRVEEFVVYKDETEFRGEFRRIDNPFMVALIEQLIDGLKLEPRKCI